MAAKTELIQAAPAAVVKLGLAHPFQVVGGDVYTFIDILKNRATMTITQYGVEVEVRSKLNGPEAPPAKKFLVPWSNVTYVLYGV